jgi:hypothetical protein
MRPVSLAAYGQRRGGHIIAAESVVDQQRQPEMHGCGRRAITKALARFASLSGTSAPDVRWAVLAKTDRLLRPEGILPKAVSVAVFGEPD